MSYTVRKGAKVIKVRHDGEYDATTTTREKTYETCFKDADWYVFGAKTGSLYREFRVRAGDVIPQANVAVADGTYPIDVGGTSDRMALKLETIKATHNPDGSENFFHGKQVVSVVSTRDDEQSFTEWAHLDEMGRIHVWKKFRGNDAIEEYERAFLTLAELHQVGQSEAGKPAGTGERAALRTLAANTNRIGSEDLRMPCPDEQLSRQPDELERVLAAVVRQKDEAEDKYNALLMQVVYGFGAIPGVDTPSGFIGKDGQQLKRLFPGTSPAINIEKLRALVLDLYPPDEAERLWARITVGTRVVIGGKLAKEVRNDSGLRDAIGEAGDIVIEL